LFRARPETEVKGEIFLEYYIASGCRYPLLCPPNSPIYLREAILSRALPLHYTIS
jgi:hypothetical protein